MKMKLIRESKDSGVKRRGRIREKEQFSWQLAVGMGLIVLLAVGFVVDGLNMMQYQLIGYDEAYNASVAANVMRYGRYRTSYPARIPFYNLITTGQSVLYPTGILYRVAGINNISSGIVPLLYGTADIFLFWHLLNKCLPEKKIKYILTAVLTYVLLMTDRQFVYTSTRLIGEAAALCFLLGFYIFLLDYYETGKSRFMVLAGAMLAFSFLTKTSMIFFVVSLSGMILIETVMTKRMEGKAGIRYVEGFFAGILVMDYYKLHQLGDMDRYIQWWKTEWRNMLMQSSGIDTSCDVGEKISYLKDIFGWNPYFCLILLAIPVTLYLVHVSRCLLRKKDNMPDGMTAAVMAGVSGSSLPVYFILLGGKGLMYDRRHAVNQLMVKFFVAYAVAVLVLAIFSMAEEYRKAGGGGASRGGEKEKAGAVPGAGRIAAAVFCLLLFLPAFPPKTIKEYTVSYIEKSHEDSYEQKLMKEFLREIRELGDDAVLYCGGWWQEPNVSLYLNRDMVSIANVSDIDRENGYFIVGRRFDGANLDYYANIWRAEFEEVDSIEVDYSRLYSYGSDKLYSIYKIH